MNHHTTIMMIRKTIGTHKENSTIVEDCAIGLGWNGLLVIVSVLMDGVAAVDVAAAIDVDVCGASFIVT